MPDIEYRFGTGQGDPHVHHSEADVDVNGDGVADGVALDFDGDGRVDDVMWDSDGDGIADTALLDLDDDGKAESAYNDPTGQGTWNAKGEGGHHETTPASAPAEPKPAEPKPEDQDRGADPELPKGHEQPGDHPGDYEPYDPSAHEGEDGAGAGNLFDNLMPAHDDGSDSDDTDDTDDGDDLFGDLTDHADDADAREAWYEELET
jgi:hypothetical protein